jgi:hypothetical protein
MSLGTFGDLGLQEPFAWTGYREKSAIRLLNRPSLARHRQTRRRPSLYDEAARTALMVLWEAVAMNSFRILRLSLPVAAR